MTQLSTTSASAAAGAAQASNPYLNPALADYLDSFEGVTWPQPAEQPQEAAARGTVRTRLHELFEAMGLLAPGIALALVLAWLAKLAAPWLGEHVFRQPRDKSPVSEILVAILLGILIRNTVGLPGVYENGLRLCLKRVLRIGIALLGLRLSLAVLGEYWKVGAPVVIVCITAALLIVTWISRALGLPRRLGTLIGVGTSICGVSAIVATAPVIDAEDDEVSYAVACITLFGLMTLFVYPFFSHWVFAGDPKQVGLFLGTAVHDTSQVTGAGLMYQQMYKEPAALNAATAVKLMRNIFMAGVIPLMAVLYHRGGAATGGAGGGAAGAGAGSAADAAKGRKAAASWHQAVPMFVLVFIALAAVRSIGDHTVASSGRALWMMSKESWQRWFAGGSKSIADQTAVWCLTIALAAVGLGTSLKKLRVLGLKPLCAGFVAAALVGAVSITMIKLLASRM